MSEQNGEQNTQPSGPVRNGWDEAFAGMSRLGDDRLLDEMTGTEWDEDEWEC